jgi:hypothetical protein
MARQEGKSSGSHKESGGKEGSSSKPLSFADEVRRGATSKKDRYPRRRGERGENRAQARHGLGHSGRKWADLGGSGAWPRISRTANRPDPTDVLTRWAQQQQNPEWQSYARQAADGHEAMATIRRYETHPDNEHLRNPAARKWMSEYILNGDTANAKSTDHALRMAYAAYDRALPHGPSAGGRAATRHGRG